MDSPENQAALANQAVPVVMRCKTNSTTKPLLWAVLDGRSGTMQSIYDGEMVNPVYKDLCSVTPNDGRYDLHVKATPQMAMTFKCIEPGAENIERTAELIVIGTDSMCFENVTFSSNDSMKVQSVSLTCVVNYTGNWAPNITWAEINGKTSSTIWDPIETVTSFKTVTGIVHVSTDAFVKDKRVFQCSTKFILESYTGDATARNEPWNIFAMCEIAYDEEKYKMEMKKLAPAGSDEEKQVINKNFAGAVLPPNMQPMQSDSTNDAVAPSKAWLFTVIVVLSVLVA